MSVAQDRWEMVAALSKHPLMGSRLAGQCLGVSKEIALEMMQARTIPSIRVGKRLKCDPLDVIVYQLAEREGVTVAEYWRVARRGRSRSRAAALRANPKAPNAHISGAGKVSQLPQAEPTEELDG